MTTPPSWLKSVCGDESRPELGAPFRIEWQGAPALMATNGHAAVILPGEYEAGESHPSVKSLPSVLAMFAATAAQPGAPVSLAALREFVGVSPEPVPCDRCDMKRVVECERCDGTGEEECTCMCGDEHDTACAACDGTGEVRCPQCGIAPDEGRIRVAKIGDGYINMRLLEAPLAYLPGDAATWHEPADAMRVRMLVGDGWWVGLMPLRPGSLGSREKNAPCFPVRAALVATEAR